MDVVLVVVVVDDDDHGVYQEDHEHKFEDDEADGSGCNEHLIPNPKPSFKHQSPCFLATLLRYVLCLALSFCH